MEDVFRFADALHNEADYIFGPDMGTDERCMAWVKDEIGRAVGRHAARFLAAEGAALVAASDSAGTLHDPHGIDVVALKAAGKNVGDYARGRKLGTDAIIDVECDIWVPAARQHP